MKKTSAVLLLVALPCVALADAPRYTYIEGGYHYLDLDDIDVDGDGWGIGGSVALTDRVHLLAGYSSLGLDFGIDVTSLDVGVGANLPLDTSLHLVGEAGYTRTEIDTRFGDFDDDGFFGRAGLRWMVTEQVELNGWVTYVNLDDSGSDTGFSVGGLFHFTPELALGASVDLGDDATGYSVGLRYYFGR
jgi:hypothetical protein